MTQLRIYWAYRSDCYPVETDGLVDTHLGRLSPADALTQLVLERDSLPVRAEIQVRSEVDGGLRWTTVERYY